MDASHTIDTIANMSFRGGKIVFEDHDALKVYFQMMTQVFLLKKGLVLTYPEKHEECENRPCLALTCFLLFKNYGSFDLKSLPGGVCGCGFKHSDMWITRTETKLLNIIKSNRPLEETIIDVVGKLEAMELRAHEGQLSRTAYNLRSKQFEIVSLPQFEREDVFFAPRLVGKNTQQRPKQQESKAVATASAAEASATRPHSDARVTAGRSWSRMAGAQPFDKASITASAIAAEARSEQLRKLIEEEEQLLASAADVQADLERKRKAEEENTQLEARLAEVRARVRQAMGETGMAPQKVVFSKNAPVIVAKKTLETPAPASASSQQAEPKETTNGGKTGEDEDKA